MANQQKEKLSKPLLPLILLLMLVILLTVIAFNLRRETSQMPLKNLEPIPVTQTLSAKKTDAASSENARLFQQEEELIRTAVRKFKSGAIEDAENDFRTILVFDPDNQAALSCLGAIFFAQKKYPEAAMLFERETKAYPGNPIAFRNLALALLQMGKIKEALEAMEFACGISPTNKVFLIETARIYAYTGDQKNTEKYLQLAKDQGADLSVILQDDLFRPVQSKVKANR